MLVGNDGQHDGAIYAQFEQENPQNVKAVAIRQLSHGEAVFAGATKKTEAHDKDGGAPWVYSPDGAGLLEQLTARGVL